MPIGFQPTINMDKTIFNMAAGIITPCNVVCGSGIITVNSPNGSTCNVAAGSGMTRHGMRPNVRHIGRFWYVHIAAPYWYDFDHITAVDMSFWTSLRIFLSKSDHLQQKKMTSCRFSRWRISAILDFMVPKWVLWKAHVRLPIGRQ